MSIRFDPYHKWLGISGAEQPPHHYRLLGIALFESDAEVIQNAADQRMAFLKTFAAGRHSVLSQTLLNQVAAASACLLDPEKKEAYDRELRATLEADGASTRAAAALDCPNCGQAVANNPELAGWRVACPHCSGHFSMPPAEMREAGERTSGLPGIEPGPMALTQWTRRRRRWSGSNLPRALVGFTVAGVLAGVLVCCLQDELKGI